MLGNGERKAKKCASLILRENVASCRRGKIRIETVIFSLLRKSFARLIITVERCLDEADDSMQRTCLLTLFCKEVARFPSAQNAANVALIITYNILRAAVIVFILRSGYTFAESIIEAPYKRFPMRRLYREEGGKVEPLRGRFCF